MSNIKITLFKQNIVNDVSAECNLLGRTIDATAKNSDGTNAYSELASNIKSVSDDETKPIVARAMSEGFDKVKEACQRFVIFGRELDDNRLESMFVTKHVGGNELEVTDIAVGQKSEILSILSIKKVPHIIHVNIEGTADRPLSLYVGNDKVCDLPERGGLELKWTPESAGMQSFYVKNDSEYFETTISGSIEVEELQWGKYELNLGMPEAFNEGVTSSVKSYAHRLIVDHIVAAILKNQSNDNYTKYIATEQQAYTSLVRTLQSRKMFGRTHQDWE